MESDSYSDAGPSQPSRQMPRRAAKLREPARVTRSAVAYNSQTSASEAQASFDETHLSSDESDSMTGDEDDDFAVPPSGGKRKASELLTAAAKRPRRTKTSPTATRSSTTPRCKAPSRRSPKKLSAKKAVPEVHVQDTPVLKGDWLSLPFMIWYVTEFAYMFTGQR